jgi:hypothetical protein
MGLSISHLVKMVALIPANWPHTLQFSNKTVG